MQRFVFDLNIDGDRLKAWYRGDVKTVLARDRAGRWVRFPAQALREFVDHTGVSGTFEVTVDATNRLQGVARLSH